MISAPELRRGISPESSTSPALWPEVEPELQEKREELVEALAESKQYLHELYEIYPASSQEAQEFERIIKRGQSGQGLEFAGQLQPTQYYLCKSNEQFAFALGTEVYLSTRLVNLSADEDTLASFPAHEIEHVSGLHLLKGKDLEEETEVLGSVLAGSARGRIHEYEADGTAPSRMQQAGYDPTAYQDALRLFIADLKESNSFSDRDHGSLYDRLSIQHWLLKVEDLTHTAKARTPKPEVLQNLPEPPNRYLKIVAAVEQADYQLAQQLCAEISFETLVKLVSAAGKGINFPRGTWSEEDYRYIPPIPTAEDIARLNRELTVCEFMLKQLEQRLETAFPDLNPTEKFWLNYIVHAQFTGSGLASFLNFEEELKTFGLDSWLPKLGWGSKVLATWPTLDSIYEYGHFVSRIAPQLGLVIKDGEKINSRAWVEFTGSGFHNNPEALQKIAANGQVLLNQRGELALTPVAAFLQRLRQSLSTSDDKLWSFGSTLEGLRERITAESFQSFMEQLQQREGERYEDDTLAVLQEHEAEILPIEVGRLIECQQLSLQYTEPDEQRWLTFLGQELSKVDRLVQDYYSFATKEFKDQVYSQYALEYLKHLRPNEYALIEGINHGRPAKAVKEFLKKYQLSDVTTLFTTCPFILSSPQGQKAYRYLSIYVGREIQRLHKKDESGFWYRMVTHDKLLHPKFGLELDEAAAAQADMTVNYKSSDTTYGFTWYEVQLIQQLDLLNKSSKGLGDRLTQANLVAFLNNLDTTRLTETGVVFIYGAVLEEIAELGQRFSRLGFRTNDSAISNEWEQHLLHPQVLALQARYAQLQNKAGVDLVGKLRSARVVRDIVNDRELSDNLLGKTIGQAKFLAPIVAPLMAEIEQRHFNLDSIEDLELIRQLAPSFQDRRLSTVLRRQLEAKMVKLMDFPRSIEFLNTLFKEDTLNTEVFDYVQEELLQTPDQLAEFEDTWQAMQRKLSKQGSESAALATFFDSGFEWFLNRHAIEFFEAALSSAKDDTQLRTLLSTEWFDIFCHPFPLHHERAEPALARPYRLKIVGSEEEAQFELTGHSFHTFVPFNRFIDEIYTRLTQLETDVFLRKALYSREGVLTTQAGRQKLYDLFMNMVVDQDQDSELTALVADLTRVILSADRGNDEDMIIDEIKLGEPLMGLLRKILFIKPAQPGSNIGAAEKIAEHFEGYQTDGGDFARAGFTPSPRTRAEKAIKAASNQKLEQEYGLPQLSSTEVEQLLKFDPLADEQLHENRGELEATDQQILRTKEHIFGLLSAKNRELWTDKLGPLKVLIEIAKSRGTLGVRFLQLLGFYIELPPEYQEELDQAYDSVKGQLKYTAYKTLQREAEAESASPALKEFWANLAELRSTGRGGSLTTVYQALMTDGSLKAVKVMVPNALMFIRQTRQETRAILAELRQKPEYQNKTELKLAEVLVDEIANWAEQDIAAVDYETQEAAFTQAHDGTTIGPIEIKVPHMTPTGTMFIKIEDWVEGESVTSFKKNGGEAQLKRQVGVAIVENYQQQLKKPVHQGQLLVHPDVHGGQFQVRMAEDGHTQLYVLDRGFWLDFSPTEANFFPLVLGQEVSADRAIKFMQFLFDLPENNSLSRGDKFKISAKLTMTAGQAIKAGEGSTGTASLLFLELRKQGVFIPLKWTLLQKNQAFLTTLS